MLFCWLIHRSVVDVAVVVGCFYWCLVGWLLVDWFVDGVNVGLLFGLFGCFCFQRLEWWLLVVVC